MANTTSALVAARQENHLRNVRIRGPVHPLDCRRWCRSTRLMRPLINPQSRTTGRGGERAFAQVTAREYEIENFFAEGSRRSATCASSCRVGRVRYPL